MYTLVSGYGITYSDRIGWKSVTAAEIKGLPLNVIANLFRKLYLTITAPIFAEPLHIDYDIFRFQNINNAQTLEVFLNELSNDTLLTIDEIPQYETKTIRYEDAFRAGYKVQLSAPSSHTSSIVAPSEKTELIINRRSTDMGKFYDYCMVTVNGYFHRTDTDNDKVYVLDGGKSLLRSRNNNMGFLSFENIGKIKQYPITEDMVYKLDDQDYFKQRSYFDLSDIDTENKTVFIVIGGYLYTPFSDVLKQFGDSTWRIDFNSVPLLERYFDSIRYLDMSYLSLSEYINNPEQINVPEFYSDEHFTKYLTGPQSFIVTINNQYMYEAKHFVRHSNLPGMFTVYEEPIYPLFTSNGKVSEYWKSYEDGHWSLTVNDAWYFHRQAATMKSSDLVTMSPTNAPYKPFYNSKGYLLELGADSLV